MSEKSLKNLSLIYSEMFMEYLNFSPNYRRNLIDLNDMHEWLKEIDLEKIFSNKFDFFILMEWFNSIHFIKPFCVIHFPADYFHHINNNKELFLTNNIDYNNLKDLFEIGILCFPKEVYDNKSSLTNDIDVWKHDKIENKIYINPHYNSEDHSFETKKSVEEIKYLYHPIQFFQLLTYLKHKFYSNLLKKQIYKKFYWIRRFNFNDQFVKIIKEKLEKKGLTLQNFIQKKSSKGEPFLIFDKIILEQNHWLIQKSLLLWLKIETIFGTQFYKSGSFPDIRIELQISSEFMSDFKKFESQLDIYNNWIDNVKENFTNYFKEEDFKLVKEFREHLEVNLRYNGLENFIDLFLYINPEKKNKLKGFLNFFVNILEIVRTLKKMEQNLIENFPNLKKFKLEPKWFEPKYFFEGSEKEIEEKEIEYKKMLLLDYNLAPKDSFVIFVEGDTEVILLEDWLKLIFDRTGIKISLKNLHGKYNDFLFKFMIKEFNTQEFFLILDQDTKNFAEGKRGNLKGVGIDEDSFHFFYPDFVTANFDVHEITNAFLGYLHEIKKVIELKCDKKIDLNNLDEQELFDKLNNKKETDKFEDIVECFLKDKFNIQMKKPDFANHLLEIMRKNLSHLERKKTYPFEEIIGKFINKILKKKYLSF